jgi:hypothetical protein
MDSISESSNRNSSRNNFQVYHNVSNKTEIKCPRDANIAVRSSHENPCPFELITARDMGVLEPLGVVSTSPQRVFLSTSTATARQNELLVTAGNPTRRLQPHSQTRIVNVH